MSNKAIFLDRDGTLIEEKNYLHRVEDVVFIPQAIEGLALLQKEGFLLFIITNQSGVGRGFFTLEQVDTVHNFICSKLAEANIKITKIYVAPEAPDQPSPGRKPSPKFLFMARDEFNLSLRDSFMIGDKLIDLECGWNAGVAKSILVRTGYGTVYEKHNAPLLQHTPVVDDLNQAAAWILNHRPHRSTRSP